MTAQEIVDVRAALEQHRARYVAYLTEVDLLMEQVDKERDPATRAQYKRFAAEFDERANEAADRIDGQMKRLLDGGIPI